jgi:regulator of sigma E protease
MDFHALFSATSLPIWLALPAFIFVISIIIVIHELGHFIAARACGVTVSAFSLGFGPEIAAFTDRWGTRWRLAWVPLGGYVKFVDDDNVSSVPTTSETADSERTIGSAEARKGFYHLKPVWQRAIIAAAGPIANFLLAIVVFAGFYMAVGEPEGPVKVDEVEVGSPAAAAGIKPGDIILKINGTALPNVERLQLIVTSSAERELTLLIDRAGQDITLKVTPQLRDDKDITGADTRVGRIGIKHQVTENRAIRYFGPIEAVQRGTQDVTLMLQGGVNAIWDLIRGSQSVSSLAGPTKILEISGKVASVGIEPLIRLLALVSVSIGFTNLLPIPVLDGGHLVFYAIEAIRGRPLSQRTQEMAFRVGLAVVLMLLVVTTVNHLTGVVGRMFAG